MSGEIGAISGYYEQYQIASWEIYSKLIDNDIEWIEFASQEAGKLDDVLIGLKHRVLAYQVKHKKSALTYRSLTNESDGLVQGLFDGWQKLKIKYPDRRIDARYITTEMPSEHDSINEYSGDKKPSFSSFINDFWDNICSGRKVNKEWEGVIDHLMQICNCNRDILFAFIGDFHFSFSYQLPNEKDYNPLKWKRVKRDVDAICSYIFTSIGKEKKTLFQPIETFLNNIGFGKRAQSYFEHDFFVDEAHYRPIGTTVATLNELVEKKNGGYVALIGSAGSGKSTLLTKWSRENTFNILRYYAYVNKDMEYLGGNRGEGKYFLHDVITQIRSQQLTTSSELLPDSVYDLKELFSEELAKLSRDFEREGRKTIIIVDGLDHIEREQNVVFSLIKQLPDPEKIPPGIYFVLGTRSVEGLKELHDSIKIDIEKDNRIVDISALTLEDVSAIVKSHKALSLDSEQLSKLTQCTLGHPLFLRYTIEKLLVASPSLYSAIIEHDQYSGDINDEYERLWRIVREDQNFVGLLGVVARFRSAFVDINVLEDDFNIDSNLLDKLYSVTGQYFNKGDISSWQYFHNSFKSFLERKTTLKTITQKYDKQKDIEFHRLFANKIANSKSNYRWNLIYHLYNSEQYGSIIEIATQEYFRSQWFEFRNSKQIFEDIGIAAKASYYENNVVALVRYLLCESELGQRLNDFEPSKQYELYIPLNKVDVANSFIFNGKELLVDRLVALNYCRYLILKGHKRLAQKIFEIAEPVYILHHSKEISTERYNSKELTQVNEAEIVIAWASVAINYQSLTDILELIDTLKVSNKHQFQKYDTTTLLVNSLNEILNTLIDNRQWDKVSECFQYLEKRFYQNDVVFDFYYMILTDLDCRGTEVFRSCLDKIGSFSYSKFTNGRKLKLCFIYAVVANDATKAVEIFSEVQTPNKVYSKEDYYRKRFFSYSLKYARLYYSLNQNFDYDIKEIMPVPDKDDEVLFDRFTCRVGFLYGKLYSSLLDTHDVTLLLRDVLNFYRRAYNNIDYSVRERKHDLIDEILNLSLKHSKSLFENCFNILLCDWQQHFHCWKTSEIRDVITFAIEAKVEYTAIQEQVVFLETKMLEGKYRSERVEECIAQAKLWIELGDNQCAESIFRIAFEQSIGIRGEKDHQLDSLVQWLPKMLPLEPDRVQNGINWYLKRLKYIQNTTSHAQYNAALSILKTVFEISGRNGIILCKWLLSNKIIEFCDAIEIALEYLAKSYPASHKIIGQIFTRILLFLQDGSNYGHNLIPALIRTAGTSAYACQLVEDVNIYAIDEKRNSLIRKIIDACADFSIDIGLKKEDFPNKEERTEDQSYRSLKLKSGDEVPRSRVLAEIRNYDDIVILMQDEDNHSYFDWIEVIENLKDELSMDELLKLRDLYGDFSSEKLARLGKLCLDKGGMQKANELALAALRKSSDAGWVRYYDGGSKSQSYKLLSQVENKLVVHDLVLKDLTFSINRVDTKALVEDIFPILDLFDNVSLPAVYNEIEVYLNELLKNANCNVDLPTFEAVDFSPEDNLFDLLNYLNEYPIQSIKETIESICVSNAASNRLLISKYLSKLYREGYNQDFINILESLSIVENDFASEFKRELIQLVDDHRFDISNRARGVLKSIGLYFEPKNTDYSLPLIYNLGIPHAPEIIIPNEARIARLENTRSLPITNDPIEYLGFYKAHVGFIAKETGIPLVNIAYQIRIYAESIQLPLVIQHLDEPQIRVLFEALNLTVSYVRPRMLRLWPGIMMALNDLYKAGLLSASTAIHVSKQKDALIGGIQVRVRPDFISKLFPGKTRDIKRESLVKKWVDETSLPTFNFNIGDRFLLAEYSVLTSLSDGRPSEIRQGYISTNNHIADEKNGYFFEEPLFNCYLNEYDECDVASPIVFNHCFSTDHRRLWLGPNPTLCHRLGWHLSESEPLKWLNENGDVVVEAVYWLDGNTGNYYRFLDSETGYGWFVVASKRAVEMLNDILGKPLYYHRVRQRVYEENGHYEKTISSSLGLTPNNLI